MSKINVELNDHFEVTQGKTSGGGFNTKSRLRGAEKIAFNQIETLESLEDRKVERSFDERASWILYVIALIGLCVGAGAPIAGIFLIAVAFAMIKDKFHDVVKFKCIFIDGREMIATTSKEQFETIQKEMFALHGSVYGKVPCKTVIA